MALLAFTGQLDAQVRDARAADSALAQLRAYRTGSLATAFLTQESRARQSAELDEIADSLVAIAISWRSGGDVQDQRMANAAATAIALSGNTAYIGERAKVLKERGLPPPVPYTGAFEALVRIFEGSPDTRGGTLYLITQLADTSRAVAFLADVATSNETSAVTAIGHLSVDMGDQGRVVLRRLYETDAVVHQTAREHLETIAIHRGWRRNP